MRYDSGVSGLSRGETRGIVYGGGVRGPRIEQKGEEKRYEEKDPPLDLI